MEVYNPNNSWLLAAHHLAKHINAFEVTLLPHESREAAVVLTRSLSNGGVEEDHLQPNTQHSQIHAGVQGHGLRVNFSPSVLQLAGHVDTIGNSGNGPKPVA